MKKLKNDWYECVSCGNVKRYMIFHQVCPRCGHEEVKEPSKVIQYRWHQKPVGYSRIVSSEDKGSVMGSVSRFKKKGYGFEIEQRLDGLKVTLVYVPVYKVNNNGGVS